MKTITLNLSNYTQGENLDTTVVDASKFKVRIPEYLRKRPYKIKVKSVYLSRINTLNQESFVLTNHPENRCPFIRHNIVSQSYDSSSSSSNTLVPLLFQYQSNIIAGGVMPIELGECYLPQEIVIERMRYNQAVGQSTVLEPLLGEEDPNPPQGYVPVAERIALIHLSLELTYED